MTPLRQRPLDVVLIAFFSVSALTDMSFYFAETFMGPHPPPHLGVYLPFNLPWLIAPGVLAWRVWRAPAGAAFAAGR
jgi:hypothetical protein